MSSHADEIDRVYRAYAASLFIVALLTIAVTIFVGSAWTSLNPVTQGIYGSLDVVLVAYVAYAYWAQRGLGLVDEIEWEVERFRFITSFELLPPRGNSPSERIWNSLKESSHIGEELKNIQLEKVKFDVEVEGKSRRTYPLDVYVHDEPRSRLLRFLSKWTLRGTIFHWTYNYFFPRLHEKLHEAQTTILVKRLANRTPVTRSDLEHAKKAFEDIGKKLRDVPEHAVVVSTSGFSNDALEYAKDEESEIKPIADDDDFTILDLIEERSDGSYKVAYYG